MDSQQRNDGQGAWFPLYLDLSKRHVLVVGGGRIAVRKLKGLVGKAKRITVVAPEAAAEVANWAASGAIDWQRRGFHREDIRQGDLVFYAANDEEVRRLVEARAAAVGAWCNDAMDAVSGDFIVPASWSSGALLIAAATGNSSPRLVKLLKRDWQDRYAELGKAATDLAVLREKIKGILPESTAREAFWRAHLPEDAIARIARGEWQDLKEEIEYAIGRIGAEP